jgi:hypothetical protein
MCVEWEWTMMMRRRAGMGLGVAVIGAALAMAPVAPAWAGLQRAHGKTHHKAKSTGGSNTGSSFCQLEKSVVSEESSSLETAATNALVAGKWSVAQKDLISIDKDTGKLEAEFIAALSSAPANVKAAASALVKFVPAEEKAVQDSTSVAGFEAAEQAAETTLFTTDAKVLAAWDTSQCGSLTPTT